MSDSDNMRWYWYTIR